MLRSALPVSILSLPAIWTAAAPYVAYVGNVPVHSTSPDAKIMVVDLAGGNPVNVSEGLYSARSPAWAPDGSLLAFQAVADVSSDIYLCRPDGTERANLTMTPDLWETAPCFVGNRAVAYLEGPDRTVVVLADLATGGKRRLTETPRFRGSLAASPEGALLAGFASDSLGGPGQIELIHTDGSGATPLTPGPAIYSVPAFSPDGTRIAFCFDGIEIGGVSRGLAVMPALGGEPTVLAPDGYPLAPVSWSPDGSQIAYTTASVYHTTWAAVVSADGGESQPLSVSPFHNIAWASFTPDGGAVVFHGVYAARFSVSVVNLATGQRTVISVEGETGVTPACSGR